MDQWQLHTKNLVYAKLKKLKMTVADFAKEWSLDRNDVYALLNDRCHSVGIGVQKRIKKQLCQTLGYQWSELWEPELWQYMNSKQRKKR